MRIKIHIVKTCAEQKGVHITFSKLLQMREIRVVSTYTMRVNILENDFDKVESNNKRWPEGVYWRDYIPYNNSNQSICLNNYCHE